MQCCNAEIHRYNVAMSPHVAATDRCTAAIDYRNAAMALGNAATLPDVEAMDRGIAEMYRCNAAMDRNNAAQSMTSKQWTVAMQQ